MPQSEVVVSYPGYRIRDDVYATHGHYLDAHNSVPTIETMLVSVSKRRRRFPADGPLTVDDYERAMAPLYAIAFRGAQRATKALPVAPGAPSKRLWELLVRDDGRTTMAGRVLGGVVLPGGVAALNRLGFGPFNPEVSGPVLRRAGLRAISESLDRMGIEASHAIFGHTHRAGPLAQDEGWVTPRGIQLHNTGNWVYEPGFLGRSPTDSPYWPGGLTFVEDEGPPRLERPLSHLRHEDFLPMLDASARALWPDQRDAEPAPPQESPSPRWQPPAGWRSPRAAATPTGPASCTRSCAAATWGARSSRCWWPRAEARPGGRCWCCCTGAAGRRTACSATSCSRPSHSSATGRPRSCCRAVVAAASSTTDRTGAGRATC
jgi:hypothetical protein